MIRDTLINFNYKTTDLVFQAVDWRCYDINKETNDSDLEEEDEIEDSYDTGNEEIDEEIDYNEDEPDFKKIKRNKALIIRCYGVTDKGNSICIHITGFQPYFFFKIPEDWTDIKFRDFKNAIIRMVDDNNKDGIVKANIIKKKEFYGFTNNELFKYGIFVFKNQSAYHSFLKIFREKRITLKKYNEEYDFSKKVYETKVSALLRFFHVRDIDPSGWLRIPAAKYKKNMPSKSRSQIDIEINYNDIYKHEYNAIAKILVASFDIECCSEDGSFPKFDKKNDPVIQIGTTVYTFGENDCKLQYIATLGACDPIEGAIVEAFKTEKELILGWADFIARLDPDIITGYNIWGFDWEYIYKRAESGNGGSIPSYHETLYKKLQRLKPMYSNVYKYQMTVQELQSSALGQNILKFIDIEGVVQIDLLKVVQRDFKLDSYKLDNVAKTFMKQQKVDLSPKELFINFKNGASDKIKEIAVYCIMDCKLVNELINKLQVITNNLGMSNVCIVPFSFLFLRGQGIKIFSLVAKFCREEDFLIKDLSDDDIDKNSYEGAIVFVPTPGIYFEPVVVMDYNSLYPSSMIAENISHDSIVGFKEYAIKPKIKPGEKDEYEVIKDTINTQYDGLDGYHYIDIEYDTFQGLDKDKKKVGYKVCRFAEADNGDKSVLPRILRKLLKARKDTRKYMEYFTFQMKDDSIVEGIPPNNFEEDTSPTIDLFNVAKGKITINREDIQSSYQTNNEFQISVLDGLQLAYKVTCNSLYGQVGASTSPICYKELAACTTSTGRKMVVTARDLTLNTFVGAKLTYGDSVTGDTPLLVMKNGFVNIMTIMDLNDEWIPYEEFKPFDTNRSEKEQTSSDYLIWTSDGWSKINRVIRHKTMKKIYRVQTEKGVIDVTEDHSLLSAEKEILKPTECSIGTELLHGFPTEFPFNLYNDLPRYELSSYVEDIFHGMIDKIPSQILNATKQCRIKFVKLFMEKHEHEGLIQTSKLFFQSLYYIFKSVEDSVDIPLNLYSIHLNGSSAINRIDYLYYDEEKGEEFVYDIETVTGNFQAGIGQLIVKNTDSIFVNFSDFIKKKYPDRSFTEIELLEESIKIGEEAAKNINKSMKAPQNIEYEKTFWPFCIFSKKRYFGNKYEHSTQKYKQTSMGIVLKRRDNAPIVKTIYGGVIDIILNKRNVEDSKKYFHDSIKDLIDGNVDISQLVISKTVKTDYANPTQIAHKVLADRMGVRDPGNKPQSNDRIPYCYVDTCNLKCKVCNIKVSPDKCKCINCMNIYCAGHLFNHTASCVKICRFCRDENSPIKCNICKGLFCKKCDDKHKYRIDKYGVRVMKCKKELTNKLLQGDTIEHPSYIQEKKFKIDYKYYLEHQIVKPVYQIFELVMDKPSTIIESLIRNMENKKNGNHSIKEWMTLMKPKSAPVQTEPDKFSLKNKIEMDVKKKSGCGVDGIEEDDDIDEESNMLDGFEQEIPEYDIGEII
jgi:DNA polymerase elongation subunit (family B)